MKTRLPLLETSLLAKQLHCLRFGLLALSASVCVAAPAHGQQSYIEAMGARVVVSAPDVALEGEDNNPLLASTSQGEHMPFRNSSVSGASNVDRQSNVPRFDDAPAQPQELQQTQNQPFSTQSQLSPDQLAAIANRQEMIQSGAYQAMAAQESGAPVGTSMYGNAIMMPDGQLPAPHIDFVQEVLNRVAPADVEQVRAIIGQLYERQAAALTPYNASVISQATTYDVDLSPGATPPVVRVSKGIGAVVNFVDTAGNPWPISFVRNFHQEAATVTQMAPHVVSVTANSPHLMGSVGVVLEGLTTPISFMVTPGQEQTDTRVDLYVPGVAPGAVSKAGQIDSAPQLAANNLMAFMHGATPDGARRLDVVMPGSTADLSTRAWQNSNGKLVLRTRAQIVSPGWYQRASGLDGTTVYELPAAPIVNVSLDGSLLALTIKGLEPLSKQVADRSDALDASNE